MADDPRRIPKATDHELRQEPTPARADAFDRMGRRLSGTVKNPDQPSNIAPVDEFEGHHADPGEGREPIDDGLQPPTGKEPR